MSNLIKRVVRSDLWIDKAFDDGLAREQDIALTVFSTREDEAGAFKALEDANIYHISAAKDELPQQWFARKELLDRCPNLICVSAGGAGYDTVDVAACTAAGIAVVNQAGGNAVSVAEHTMGLMLGVSRRMLEGDRRMRREIGYAREDVMGHEISGKTLGLVGIGHIGTRVAALARAFGMQVLATDPHLTNEEIERRGAKAVKFEELLAASDFVSLHCPRDASSMKMMNDRAFSIMKRGAIFITTARGGIHDEAALVQALQSGHLAGAGIDVWDQEPPDLDHPLLAMDNVFATFHVAGVTHEARRNMGLISVQQIVGILKGERPPRLINPEVWPEFEKRRNRIFS